MHFVKAVYKSKHKGIVINICDRIVGYMEMSKKQLEEQLLDIKKRISEAIIILKLDQKESELDLLEEQSKKSNFWENQEIAKKIMQKVNSLKEVIGPWRKLEKDATDLVTFLLEAEDGDNIISDIQKNTHDLLKTLESKEKETYFSGKYDSNNSVVSIYAGAGGVDAQDWSEILLSMLLKYANKKNLTTKIISITPGSEAGIKSASFEVEGPFSYGLLKSERGVHRLVRISPYDADKARHTSFSLVEVIPEIESDNLKIEEKDIKVDTFKASGHGGQSVNTTDSAVRLSHIPTGIVVSCQNERSQLQNKETAFKILRARILAQNEAEKEEELKIIKGDNINAEWGSQIRSYVQHPYTIVKDHRTKFETSNVGSVLNGELDDFVEAYLKISSAK